MSLTSTTATLAIDGFQTRFLVGSLKSIKAEIGSARKIVGFYGLIARLEV